jgi:hypothetical protein
MTRSAIIPTRDGGDPRDSIAGRVPGLMAVPENHQSGRGSWYLQVALAVSSWIVLCVLHWHNDGLWFPQDAPRHLINGVFLNDYIAAGLPAPVEYAQSYLVRYPIIVPTKYPPGFHLLEAATFSVFEPSPWAAKGLILGFALFAVLYEVAWLRRFVAPGAGYLATILPLLPALYHARRWLEGRGRSHLYAAAAFVVAALLCYQGAAVVVLILGTWIALTGPWRLLSHRRDVLVVVAVLLAPILLIAWNLTTSGQARWLVYSPYIGRLTTWLWYPSRMTDAFGPFVVIGAAVGVVAGSLNGRWRPELTFSGGWIGITYLFHTYILGKDIRYILPLCTPLLSLTAVAVWSIVEPLRQRLGRRVAAAAGWAAFTTVVAMHLGLARSVVLPRVDGFEAIVATIQADPGADRGSILAALDTINWALLTCFVRLDDPEFKLRVLPGSWFWTFAGVAPRPDVAKSGRPTDAIAIESLLAHSGCRWIVVDVGQRPETSGPQNLKRELSDALRLPRFQHVGTFAIRGPSPTHVALYRQVGEIGNLCDLAAPAESGTVRSRWLLREPVTKGR